MPIEESTWLSSQAIQITKVHTFYDTTSITVHTKDVILGYCNVLCKLHTNCRNGLKMKNALRILNLFI